MKKKLNICLLLPNPFNEKLPARPAIMEIYGEYFPNFGHKITWFMPGTAKKVEMKKFKKISIYVIPPYRKHASFPLKILNYILHLIREYELLKTMIKKKKYDIIQVRNDIFLGLIALRIGRKYNLPIVFQLSFPKGLYTFGKITKHIFFFFGKFEKFMLKYILLHADLILPISNGMKNQLINKGIPENKLLSIPLGVNQDSFSPLTNRTKIRNKYGLENKKIIVYIGSMDKLRKLDLLIYAFSKILKHQNNNLKLLMVGDGNDRNNLEKLSRDLGMQNDVIFTKNVAYSEIPFYIASSDVCISPIPPISQYMISSPAKLYEYMSMEKPVVANEEILEQKEAIEKSGGGILVEYNIDSFSKTLNKLLNNMDDAQKMGKKGREWILNNRTYENMTIELETRYFELLECHISI